MSVFIFLKKGTNQLFTTSKNIKNYSAMRKLTGRVAVITASTDGQVNSYKF